MTLGNPSHLQFKKLVEGEPLSYKVAMGSSEAPYWEEAIQSEIDSIVQNNTCKLVDLPPGHKVMAINGYSKEN